MQRINLPKYIFEMTCQMPKVRYHTTVNAEEAKNDRIDTDDAFAVNNVVKVIDGTLSSVLHLIGYSYLQIKQINRQLAIKYRTQQKSKFDLSYLESQISDELKNGRPSRAHIVEWNNQLYGVIVDEGKERICGLIRRTIPKTVVSDKRPITKRAILVDNCQSTVQEMKSETEIRHFIKSGKNLVIASEKGWIFVVAKSVNIEHENELTLVLGHGFVVIDNSDGTPVHWVRTQQDLKEEKRESTRLEPNQSIVVSFGAVCVEDRVINVYGNGTVIDFDAIQRYYLPIN